MNQTNFPLSLDGVTLTERDADLTLSALLELAGENGGRFLLRASGGRIAVERVAAAADVAADVLVKARLDELLAILDGRDDAQLALRTGRLVVSGEMTLAMRLRGLLTAN